jgi:carbon starvation protein
MARALVGVLVASFAGTTLDTATRLQRYVVQELAGTLVAKLPGSAAVGRSDNPLALPLSWLTTPHGATLFAVGTAFLLALLPAPGKDWSVANLGTGGLILWPLFGATNQLLAGLSLLVISFYLRRRGLPTIVATLPMILMLVMPAWALCININRWLAGGSLALVAVAIVMLAVEAWMAVEGLLLWGRVQGVLEEPLPPLPVSCQDVAH